MFPTLKSVHEVRVFLEDLLLCQSRFSYPQDVFQTFSLRWSIQRSPSPIHRKLDAFSTVKLTGSLPVTPPKTGKVTEKKKVTLKEMKEVTATGTKAETEKEAEKQGENFPSGGKDSQETVNIKSEETPGKKEQIKEISSNSPSQQAQDDSKLGRDNTHLRKGKICKSSPQKLFL